MFKRYEMIEPTFRSILAVFFLQALAAGGIFTRIPDIKVSLGLTEAQLGLVLVAQPLGGLVSFLAASWLVERFGTRMVCNIGLPLLAIASFGFAASPGVIVAVLALILYGMSFSVVNVAMNVEADAIETQLGRRIMSRCHGLWSLGFLFAAALGVLATAFEVSPALHMGAVVPLVLIATLALSGPLGLHNLRPQDGSGPGLKLTLPTKATLSIVGFGLLGSVLQSATQNWSVLYMQSTFEISDWTAALSIPFFLVSLTIGRLSGDAWLNRFGPRTVAFVLIGTSFAGLALVIAGAHFLMSLVGFCLIGLGVSILFPMMITAAAALGDRPASANVASVTMATGLAMLCIPPMVGMMAEFFGLRLAFVALLPFFLVAIGFVGSAVPQKSQRSAAD